MNDCCTCSLRGKLLAPMIRFRLNVTIEICCKLATDVRVILGPSIGIVKVAVMSVKLEISM